MQKRGKITLRETTHPRYRYVLTWWVDGKRQVQYFKHGQKGAADARRDELLTDAHNVGVKAASSLSDGEKRFLTNAKAQLAGYGRTIEDAVNHYLAHLQRTVRPVTVRELVNELRDLKEREGRSEVYQRDLRLMLGRFADTFGERQVAEIATQELNQWLSALALGPVSTANYRRTLGVLFSFGCDAGYIDKNPVEGAMKPKLVQTEIGILTPTEAHRLLAAAHPDILPTIAIGLFAGLRRAELQRLDWRDIDLEGGHVEVTARNAKSARRRLVRIQSNLSQWLAPHAKLSGPVWPEQMERGRNLLDEAKRAAGFGEPGTETAAERKAGVTLKRWPGNAMRHSFASHHLAHFKNAAELALEMGHTRADVLFAHYRQLVKERTAAAYWNICPAGKGKIVGFRAKAA